MLSVDIYRSENNVYYADFLGVYFDIHYDFLLERNIFLRTIAELVKNPGDFEQVEIPSNVTKIKTINVEDVK